MSATNDNGMGDVATDEVDEDMLSMTQGMRLPHVVGDEVTGDGYPVCAVASITVIRLPVISDMCTMITVMGDSTAIRINNTGAH